MREREIVARLSCVSFSASARLPPSSNVVDSRPWPSRSLPSACVLSHLDPALLPTFGSFRSTVSLVEQPPFVRPARDPNDPTATSYFGGDVLEWDESDEQGHFRTRNRFKAGSRHSGNGKKGSAVPPLHIHLYQTEVLECVAFPFSALLRLPLADRRSTLARPQIEGSMSYHLNGKEGVAKPGDKLVVPPGSTHTFWLEADAKEDLVMSATAMGGTRPGFDARL